MGTHPGMLLAYDAAGDVVATLDFLVQYDDDPDRTPLGIVRWDLHEEAGGDMTEVWTVDGAKGSKVWPEYLGSRAHDFRAELTGPAGRKRINALVHKSSGVRRERAALEATINARVAAAKGGPADIRDLVGGPTDPLFLDDEGRSVPRPKIVRPTLPLAVPLRQEQRGAGPST